MGVKSQVFASRSERENFYKLSRQWGSRYRLYHNLPFLNVFTVDNLIDLSDWQGRPIVLSDVELSRLKKTSVDYTLCDQDDSPLVCIEFDGLQQGFNVGTHYHPKQGFDNWRQQITELKLKVAHNSLFPYFVVSSDHFNNIARDIQLTIVDGIIGEVLAHRAFRQRFQEFNPSDYGYSQAEFDSLPRHEQQDIIDDWGIDSEVSTQMENNPVYRQAAALQHEMTSCGACKQFGYQGVVFPAGAKMDEAILVGEKYTVYSEQYGNVERTVLLPNFRTPGFYFGGLAESIAELLAFTELKRRVELGKNKPK
jgi:hypothetical protein